MSGTFHLTIDTGNAAFEDDPESEVARLLRVAADRIGRERVRFDGKLLDINGNIVGSWAWSTEEPVVSKPPAVVSIDTLPGYAVTDQAIDDILTTAFEGGINYWTGHNDVKVIGEFPEGAAYASECVSRGTNVEIAEQTRALIPDGVDDDPLRWHTLTKAMIVRGIRHACHHLGVTPEAFAEDHDAGGADLAVQFALFNEIVYG